METTLIFAALGLGLGTSLHCLGMCGPIAFSLGIGSSNSPKFITKNFTYQFGRVTTYTFLGFVLGIVGSGITFSGGQQYLSIIAGVFMIAMAILPKNLESKVFGKGFVSKWLFQLKNALGNSIRKKNYSALFITGLLNGLLPCGAVYAALTAALGVGNATKATFFMFLFGIGTVPLMYLAVLSSKILSAKKRNQLAKILPIITITLGVIFILRGLGLGITFISPMESSLELNAQNHSCH